MDKERQHWIDAVKGLCIILVVLYHTIQQVDVQSSIVIAHDLISLSERAWSFFIWALAPARMPVFFAISGMLVSRYISQVPLIDSLEKRVLNYLWMFFVWNIVLWGSTYLIGYFSEFGHPYFGRTDGAFFAASLDSFIFNVLSGNTGLWYIYALAIYFLIAKVGYPFRWVLLSLSFILFYVAVSTSVFSLEWGSLSLLRNVVFFLCGAYCGRDFVTLLRRRDIGVIALVATSVVVTCVSHWVFGLDIKLAGSFAAIILCWFIGIQFNRFFSLRALAWLGYLGKNTLPIYLLHTLVIHFFVLFFFSDFWLSAARIEWLYFVVKASYPIIVCAVAILVSVVTGRWLREQFPLMFVMPAFLSLSRFRVKAVADN